MPTFGSSVYGHSQPLPTNDATLSLAKTTLGYGCDSSVVRLARDVDLTIDLSVVNAVIAWGESSVPTHLPLRVVAILPPQS